jgi:hypothetical protein
MMEPTPLDLRSLGDVDSPEVVREALRIFRRRIVTRYIWVVVIAVLLAVAVWRSGQPANLAEEMDAANVRSFPEQVYRLDGNSVAVAEVSELGDDFGLRMIVIPDDPSRAASLRIEEATEVMGSGPFELFFRVPKDEDGILHAELEPADCAARCRETSAFEIDLASLLVPENLWRAEP